MAQLFLYIPLYVVGLSISLACGPAHRPLLCCARAFILGLAVAGLSAVLLLVSRIPYGAASFFTLMALIAAAGLYASHRWKRLRQFDLRQLALASLAFVLIAVLACSIHVSRMSFDSHFLIMLGQGIAGQGELDAFALDKLSKWSVIVAAHHSLSELIGVGYLYSLAPLTFLSLLALFAVALVEGVRSLECRVGLLEGTAIGIVTLAVFTTFFFGFHGYYIHANLPTAVFLLAFAASFWQAEIDDDAGSIPIAAIFLATFALVRLENPVVAIVLIGLTFFRSRLSERVLTWSLLGVCGVIGGWFLLRLGHVEAEDRYLTPMKVYGILGLYAAAVALWFMKETRPVSALARWFPRLSLGMVALGLIVAFLVDGVAMAAASRALYTNLTQLYWWGLFWYAAAAVGLIGLLIRPVRFGEVFVVGALVFVGGVFMLGVQHVYRTHYYDSGNRMMVHVVPLIFFYFGLKITPRLRSAPTSASVTH